VKKETQEFIDAARFPIYFIILIWIIHILKIVLESNITSYGIFPRSVIGLKGIILAPLIHGDFTHLISNTVPLFVLGLIVFLFYRKVALISFLIIYITTGLMVWMFSGSMAYHIGASGVVYGLLSFVFWNGIFRRNVKSIVLALVVLVLYSGYFLGLLPDQEGVSWESHLFGAVVGIAVSFMFKSTIEEDEVVRPSPWADEDPSSQKFFLPRNSFVHTKAEREALRQAEIQRQIQIKLDAQRRAAADQRTDDLGFDSDHVDIA